MRSTRSDRLLGLLLAAGGMVAPAAVEAHGGQPPSIVVTATPLRPGSLLEVKGMDFAPGEPVSIGMSISKSTHVPETFPVATMSVPVTEIQ